MEIEKVTPIKKEEEPKPDFLDRYIETDRLIKDGITLKAIADNLRSYPVIVVFWLAIAYLWHSPSSTYLPSFVPQCVAILWGAWVFMFSLLTAIQSGFLVVCAVVDLLRAHNLLDTRPKIKTIAMIVSAILAVVFMFSAWFIVEGILNGIRR